LTDPSSRFDCEAKLHDWGHEYGQYVHLRRLEILRKLIAGRGSSLALDVGCGGGYLRESGVSRAIGIDIRRGQAVTVVASAEFLPFRDQCFQLLFAGEVIEHLKEPARAIKDWGRVLGNDGRMILSTPNGILVDRTWNPDHLRMFTPRDVKQAIRLLGFGITQSKGIFTGLISGRRIFRWIPIEGLKLTVLRLPVPLMLSYDFFISAEKKKGN
jgi:SAM-dependent methyltransferase